MILKDRSMLEGLLRRFSSPSGCLIDCWWRGDQEIVKRHQEGLRFCLLEMGQEDGEQEEDDAKDPQATMRCHRRALRGETSHRDGLSK
jgi:hypothetical protein